MPISKVILDSNSYFRLAKSIHPLLNTEFGDPPHCLYVLKELNHEYKRSSTLATKFTWVDEQEYVENRNKIARITSGEAQRIQITQTILRDEKNNNSLGVSQVDITYLATCKILMCPVVTDDSDMLELALIFNIQTMKTLNLMKLMLDCKHISNGKIREIIQYWRYENDLPKDFKKDFKSIFKKDPP